MAPRSIRRFSYVAVIFLFFTSPGFCTETFLLIANGVNIQCVSLEVPEFVATPIIDNLTDVGSLDWDSFTEQIFWADFTRNTINVANLDGTNQHVLISDYLKNLRGIAIDWINWNIYWTDTTADQIQVADLNGGNRNVLLYRHNVSGPIVVHPMRGLMFFAEDSPSTIWRAGLAGTRPTIIVMNLTRPTALALDFEDDRIYWVDHSLGIIESAYLDGSNRQILLMGLNLPHGVALHGDFLYWIDSHDLVVQRTNKTDPTNREIIIRNLDTPRDIQVYDRKRATLTPSLHPPLPSAEPALLIVGTLDIRRVLLDVPKFFIPPVITDISTALALDWDADTEQIFWTDTYINTINVANLNGTDQRVLISENLTPQGITLDWINRKLYWTDSSARWIEVADLDGGNRTVIVSESNISPGVIVVHPMAGKEEKKGKQENKQHTS